MMNRRQALRSVVVAAGSTVMAGCGGGAGADETAQDPQGADGGTGGGSTGTPVGGGTPGATPETPPLTAEPSLPTSRYRNGQTYLFQPVPQRFVPSRLPEGRDRELDLIGPNWEYADRLTGWAWERSGGDWIDRAEVRHGASPWFTVLANAVSGATASAAYEVDVTEALQYIQTRRRWCAFLLRSGNAQRAVAGLHQSTHAWPAIRVTYANGSTATLGCRIVASARTGSSKPSTTAAEQKTPLFLEFQRPRREVARAVLSFVVTVHASHSNPLIEGFIVDPPMNTARVRLGLADASATALDASLATSDRVIGVHRYVDGSTWTDFAHLADINTGAEREYDPAIWERGDRDTDKLPHTGNGKWIAPHAGWSLVPSSYTGESFAPLAPGLGAMRLHMPAVDGMRDGFVGGYSGTQAGNGRIFLPEPLFGRLDRIFVRYYVRVATVGGDTYERRAEDTLHVYKSPTLVDPAWVDNGGKFGIMPDHVTSYGGVSGSSGGGNGWQMRLRWSDTDIALGGPNEGGIAAGLHLYDFYFKNPPGHNYTNDTPRQSMFGQQGGLGGVLFANQWYCIEAELKLNRVDQPAVLPDGSPHVIDGVRQYWTPDGEVRVWVDGRLAFERTGMVFRSLPLVNAAYKDTQLRPCRDLGIRSLWLNWFHGGTTPNQYERVTFLTGLAWGHDYIGPMKL